MPPLLRQHNAVRVVEIERVDALARFLERGAVDFLTTAVHLLELARNPVRLRLRLGEQQLDSLHRVANAAGGVEPRRKDESDATRSEWPAVGA